METAAHPAEPRAMRLAKREITDPDALRAIVEACPIVRIGVVDNEGVFVVPMSFGYDWEEVASTPGADAPAGDSSSHPRLTLWLHSAREGRKAAAFDAGGRVAIEMDIQDGVISGDFACAYSYAYRSIMGSGRITREDDPARMRHALARIMAHLAPDAPTDFADNAIARTNIYRIDVDHFTGKQRV